MKTNTIKSVLSASVLSLCISAVFSASAVAAPYVFENWKPNDVSDSMIPESVQIVGEGNKVNTINSVIFGNENTTVWGVSDGQITPEFPLGKPPRFQTIIGNNNTVKGEDTFVAGHGITAGEGATAVNSGNVGNGGVGVGFGATTNGQNGVALGLNTAAGDSGTAVGGWAQAEANGLAVGAYSGAGANAVALGNDAAATGLNSVAVGTGSVAKKENEFSVGSDAVKRQVTNVADGQNANDAVNVSQLNVVDAKAEAAKTAADTALNKATAAETKADTALTTANTALDKATVADAKAEAAQTTANTALDKATAADTKADTALNKATAADTKADTALDKATAADTKADAAQTTANAAETKADNAQTTADTALDTAVQAETNANQYTDNSVTENNKWIVKNISQAKTESVKTSNDYTDSKLKDFKFDGSTILNEANQYTDNSVKQVYTKSVNYTYSKFNQLKADTDKRFNQVDQRMDKLDKRVNAGLAGVTAISSIPYVTCDNGCNTYSFGMGAGNYKNGNAVAAGLQVKTSANTNFRANLSLDSENNSAVGAGFAVGW